MIYLVIVSKVWHKLWSYWRWKFKFNYSWSKWCFSWKDLWMQGLPMKHYEGKLLIHLIVSPKDILKSLGSISLTESRQLQNWTCDTDTPVAEKVRGFLFVCFGGEKLLFPFDYVFYTCFPTKAFLEAWSMVLLLMERNRSNFALKDSFIWPWLMVPTISDIEGNHWIKICWEEGRRERGFEYC